MELVLWSAQFYYIGPVVNVVNVKIHELPRSFGNEAYLIYISKCNSAKVWRGTERNNFITIKYDPNCLNAIVFVRRRCVNV